MADRYCRNCGHHLAEDDRFCPNCGRAAHETAHMPTPEADRSVPPPPRAAAGTSEQGGIWSWIPLAVLLAIAIIVAAAIGTGDLGDGESANRGGGGADGSPAPDEAQGAGEGQYSREIGTFTKENYGVLVANPDEHVGAEVEITGQLLDNPESAGDEVAFQMWADPNNAEWNTVVRTGEEALGLGSDDYVRVAGTVTGAFEGENAFGGTVSAVGIDADEVERVDAVEALDPTQKTIQVGRTQGSADGFSITLEKLDISQRYTRAHVAMVNNTSQRAGVDVNYGGSKIIQGEERTGLKDPFDYNLPKPRAKLEPGGQTEGVVIFGGVDPSQPFQVSFAWEYGGYMSDKPEPLVFEVNP